MARNINSSDRIIDAIQRINQETEDYLQNKLKPKCTVGLVGGSDLKKIAEQMGGMDGIQSFNIFDNQEFVG